MFVMSKNKKDLAKELQHLKIRESNDTRVGSEALDLSLDLNLTDIELANDGKSKTSVALDSPKDQTIRLVHTSDEAKKNLLQKNINKNETEEEAIVSYGLPSKQQTPRLDSMVDTNSDSNLKQSEYLRIAQKKINNLEDEISKLRRENEELGSAGETFKKLNDEYFMTIDGLKAKIRDQKLTFNQEVELLKRINLNKDKQITEFKQQVDEYKSRIDNNFQRVRKREKDLEHRLEIAKIEEVAVVKSKDQLILDLKRRIDELSQESDNFRKKSQENYKDLQKKQQVVRGVVRALRMALTKLEGDDDSDFGLDITQAGPEDDQ
jgi:hypothetical protein